MNADHVEPLLTHRDEAMKCLGPDDDDVAGAGSGLFSIDSNRSVSGPDDARLGIRVQMQSRTCAGPEVAEEKRDPRTVWLNFERDGSD